MQGMMPPGGVAEKRVQERRTLLQSVDAFAKRAEQQRLLEDLHANQERAYGVILGDAKKAFDLSQEKDDLRERTGATPSGKAACWPAGSPNAACRSSPSTWAVGTRTPTTSGP